MKICLINPNINPEYNMDSESHLGLAYIAATLVAHGHEADIIDAPISKFAMEDIVSLLHSYPYQVFGISCYYFNYISFVRISRYIRKTFPKAFIFAGGYLPTLASDKIRSDLTHINCFVLGEGEITTLHLVENLQNQRWMETSGITYMKNGLLVKTSKAQLVENLDDLPFPLRNKKNIKYHMADVAASRGCYGHCSFCGIHEFYKTCDGHQIRRRSPQNVVAELLDLKNQYGVNTANFIDDNFCINSLNGKKWFNEFYLLVKQNNLKMNFQCNFRANEVIESKDIIERFIEIGLNRIFLGIESFLNRHLKFYNKMITAEQNIKSLEIVDDLGVNYDIGYLLFNPITTLADIRQTVEIVKQIHFNQRNKHIIRPFSAAVVNSPHGTMLDQYILDNNLKSQSHKGYTIQDKKARRCYEITYQWKLKIDPIYLNRELYNRTEDMHDVNMMNACKALFYQLFYLDMSFLEKVSDIIDLSDEISDQEVNELVNLWLQPAMEIGRQLDELKQIIV